MSGKEIHTKETFQVLGMSCAVCALNVETTLGKFCRFNCFSGL